MPSSDPKLAARAAQDLVAIERLDDAWRCIEAALQTSPNHPHLLAAAIGACRAIRDREASLAFSLRLVAHHPAAWTGYARAAEDLTVLLRFDEAIRCADDGLARHADHVSLLKIKGEACLAARSFVLAEEAFEAGQLAASDADAARRFRLDKYFAQCLDGRKPAPDPSLASLQVNDRYIVVHGPPAATSGTGGAPDQPMPTASTAAAGVGSPAKRYLFVSGLARSGTTALGSLLNLSQDVCIFTELYRAFRPEGYSPADFSVRSIEGQLQAHPHQAMDRDLYERRYRDCLYVGGKRPFLQFALERSLSTLGLASTRVVHVSRELRSVCMSAERRAGYPDDPWSVTRGAEAMICLYNRTTEAFVRLAQEWPEAIGRITFVDYDRVFSDRAAALGLFAELGIELSDHERALVSDYVADATVQVQQSRQALADTPSHIQRAIEKLLDRELHEQFVAISRGCRP